MSPELIAPYNKLHKAFEANWDLKTSILSLRPRKDFFELETKHGNFTIEADYVMSTAIDQLVMEIMSTIFSLKHGVPPNIFYDPDYYKEEEITPFNLEDFQQSEP